MKITDDLTKALSAVSDARLEVSRAQSDLDFELKEIRGRKLAKFVPATAESMAQAASVVDWCRDFSKAWEHNRIFEQIGEHATLPLFRSRFWKGQPAGDDPEVAATFGISSCHLFDYEERRGNLVGQNTRQMVTQVSLVDALHPVFLKKLAERLTGPDAFAEVAAELDRTRQRILTVGVR